MSDQSLRAAMEKALDDELCTCEQCEDGDKYNDGVRSVQKAVREVLAAHPAEPVPVVTDEAVDALAHVLFDREWVPGDWRWEQYPEPNRWQEVARKGLEAAAPLLGPRPLLDREAVLEALAQFDVGGWKYDNAQEFRDRVSAALLKLARPMPTRWQIEAALGRGIRFGGNEDEHGKAVDAVLALLNGAAS